MVPRSACIRRTQSRQRAGDSTTDEPFQQFPAKFRRETISRSLDPELPWQQQALLCLADGDFETMSLERSVP